RRTYTVRVVPVRDEVTGEIWSGAVTVQDITARKREEAELRDAGELLQQAEARYRTLVEQLPLVTYIRPLDLSAANIYVSPQVEQLFGIPRERWESDPELLQKHVHPEDLEGGMAAAKEVRTSGVPFRGEYRFVRPDGETVWVQDETYLVRDADGRPVRVEGYVLDITERKRAEAERDRLQNDLLH